jgi:hypothetical protein
MMHHPLNGILPLLIVPLMTTIIRNLKKPVAPAQASPVAATAEQK